MDDFSLWDVFISLFWFMLLVAWISLVFRIITDVFRDERLSGAMKAFWTFFIIVLPWLGVLVYLIARGGSMNRRAIEDARVADERMRAYVRDVAGTGSGAGGSRVTAELDDLAALRDAGTISADDYEKAKVKVLG